MADDANENLTDLPEGSLTPELRGHVVDVEQDARNWLWVGFGVILLIGIMVGSWAYLLATRTEEQILKEKLASHQHVRMMLEKVSDSVSNPESTKQEIQSAIREALHVTKTPLRVADFSKAPKVPERNAAIVEILKGILRLRCEKMLLLSHANDVVFHDDVLGQLADTTLEYYENGLIKEISLFDRSSQSPHLRTGYVGADEDLSNPNIVGPALLLGKWYRYQNDLENARTCFEIGRQYVEGYRRGNIFYEGFRPSNLGPLWSSYVECLEALADLKMNKEQYRMARSYLVRMFHTPRKAAENLWRIPPSRDLLSNAQVANLKRDLSILRRAAPIPERLTTFPLVSEHDRFLRWDLLVEALQNAARTPGREPENLLFEELSDATAAAVKAHTAPDDPSEELKLSLITHLNALIQSDSFFKRVSYDKDRLSKRAIDILSRGEERSLNYQELTFLNRDIIDTALPKIMVQPFVLSDGTRLTNQLSPEEISQFVSLLEEELTQAPDLARAKKLRTRLYDIYQKRTTPTIQEFASALRARIASKNEELSEVESDLQLDLDRRQGLYQRLQALSNVDTIHIGEILELKESLQMIEGRSVQSKIKKAQLTAEVKKLIAMQEGLGMALRAQLKDAEEKLELALSGPKQVDTIPVDFSRQQLQEQLDRQINLRQKYTHLLSELLATSEEKVFTKLPDRKKRLEEDIRSIEDRISLSQGNEREELEKQRDQMVQTRHNLLLEFHQLFDPLREVAGAIAEQEDEIWQAEKLYKETRSEILKIIGTEELVGSLEDKTRRRASLLLAASDDAYEAPILEKEIENLTQEIADEQGKLQVLLQTEQLAKESLALLFPKGTGGALLFAEQGALEPLEKYLQHQDRLMREYTLVWQENEIREDLEEQELRMLASLEKISEELENQSDFSPQKTQSLTRAMQEIIDTKNKMGQGRRMLRDMREGSMYQNGSQELSGKGFRLDSVEMFQMEHMMGLAVTKYRTAFEERTHLINEIHRVLSDKRTLDTAKIKALQERDQLTIDSLVHQIAEKEGLLNNLMTKQRGVNAKLRGYIAEYEANLNHVTKYRKTLEPRLFDISTRISHLREEMAKADKELANISSTLLKSAVQFEKSLTTLTIGDLSGLSNILEQQQGHLDHLLAIRNLQRDENTFRATALWKIALTLFNQSQMETLGDLERSNFIPVEMRELEARLGVPPYEEFDEDSLYDESSFTGKTKGIDHSANVEKWTAYLESSALKIFKQELPDFTHESDSTFVEDDHPFTAENKLIIAKSKFLAGEIHMKRAIRLIRSSNLPPPHNEMAVKELDQASNDFIEFLDFVAATELTMIPVGEQEFPLRTRIAVDFRNDAQVYLGVIATLKQEYSRAIEHYRGMLTRLIEDTPQASRAAGRLHAAHTLADPLLATDISHRDEPDPIYGVLLSYHPLAHELLYRLGRTYELLALEEAEKERTRRFYDRFWNPDIQHNAPFSRKKLEKLANTAIAYFSQGLLTQTHSQFRSANFLHRARMHALLGQYELSQEDLISILALPDEESGSMLQSAMTTKGDIPGELAPGPAFVWFELGKVYLDAGDALSAQDAFLQARKNDPDNLYVLPARIAFTESLVAGEDWFTAMLFLEQLLQERATATPTDKPLYHPDLDLKLAKAKVALGSYNGAIEVLSNMAQFAPRQLVTDGRINLSDQYGMTLLQTEYRDAIRPLAESLHQMADTYMLQHQFHKASIAYSDANKLYRIVPWREDRLLRQGTRGEWEAYRLERLTQTAFGPLRASAAELIQASFSGYRKQVMVQETRQSAGPAELSMLIGEVLSQLEDNRAPYEQLVVKLQDFYNEEVERLPETKIRIEVMKKRQQDRQAGGQGMLRYEALSRMHQTVAQRVHSNDFMITDIKSLFPQDSLEEKFLEEFTKKYATTASLTEDDRAIGIKGTGSILNIGGLPDAVKRFTDYPERLQAWIESEMVATGLDTQFIPLSPQSRVLEDCELFRLSLLSYLDTPATYREQLSIIESHLAKSRAIPKQIHSSESLWEMVRIGAGSAEWNQDWKKAEQYYRYLVDHFVEERITSYDGMEITTFQMGLARALLKVANQESEEIAFTADEEEKIARQQVVDKLELEARTLLTELTQISGNDTPTTMTRVFAKQMLKQGGV